LTVDLKAVHLANKTADSLVDCSVCYSADLTVFYLAARKADPLVVH
jgi:hypothetical protein